MPNKEPTNDEKDLYREVSALNRAVFGDDKLGEKGMKDKVDEMYDIVKTAKLGRAGIIWVGGAVLAITAIITFLKGGFK